VVDDCKFPGGDPPLDRGHLTSLAHVLGVTCLLSATSRLGTPVCVGGLVHSADYLLHFGPVHHSEGWSSGEEDVVVGHVFHELSLEPVGRALLLLQYSAREMHGLHVGRVVVISTSQA